MTYITTDDVYRACGITSANVSEDYVASFIEEAESTVEQVLNTTFQPDGKTLTDYKLDGTGTDSICLPFYPIKTISALSVSSDGINYTSVTTSKLWTWNATGKIQLRTDAEVRTFYSDYPQAIKITYTYGDIATPHIKRFTCIICGIKALTAQMGGTFDDVTSYQLPELSASKGEPWTNIFHTLELLEKEMKFYLEQYARPKVAMG